MHTNTFERESATNEGTDDDDDDDDNDDCYYYVIIVIICKYTICEMV